MADIKAFRGYRYKLENPNDLGMCCAPPYDMIDYDMVPMLYEKHHLNVVRVTQNKRLVGDKGNKDRHIRAAQYFNEWIEKGDLAQDERDSVYIYKQNFSFNQNGKMTDFERLGICVLVKLVDFEEQIVLPHEYTLSGPKQDRYELMETTNANTGQIFGLATDDDGAMYALIKKILEATTPVGMFTDENNVTHTLHKCDDNALIDSVVALMKTRNILIADGHHRYETALRFYRDKKDEAFSHVMMTLVSTADPGLVIRPFHRLVYRTEIGRIIVTNMKNELANYFDLVNLGKASAQLINETLAKPAAQSHEIVFWDCKTGELHGLTLNANGEKFLSTAMPERSAEWKKLDVSKINCIVINGILELPLDGRVLHDVVNYVNDADDGAKRLTEEAGDLYGGFFIRPVSIDVINDTVKGGERMPQKSTNFFPKLYSGLVFNKMA